MADADDVTLTIGTLGDDLDLELCIPMAELMLFTRRPRKLLRFIGYAISGLEGYLSHTVDGVALSDDIMLRPTLEGDRVFFYVIDQEGYDGQSLATYINPSLVAPGGSSTTSTETLDSDLRNAVLHRDGGRDPFAFHDLYCEVHHFIRFSRSNFFTHVMTDRSSPDDDLDLTIRMRDEGVNCIQNGITVDPLLHKAFGAGHAAILKTPNKYLDLQDVPPSPTDRYENGQVPPRPLQYRYTAQLFHPGVISGSYSRARNLDAIFPPEVLQQQLPHPVILNYAYGYAVLLRWGKQIPTVITHLRTHKGVYVPPLLQQDANKPRFDKHSPDDGTAPRKKCQQPEGIPKNGGALNIDNGTDCEHDGNDGSHINSEGYSQRRGLSSKDAWSIMHHFSMITPLAHHAAKAQQQEKDDRDKRMNDWLRSQPASY